LRLDARVRDRKLNEWKIEGREKTSDPSGADESAKAALIRNFEFRLPLGWLLAMPPVDSHNDFKSPATGIAATSVVKLRVSLWHNRLPVDALPVEGWMELQLLSEAEMGAGM
jgi:hypothetical protein